MSELKATTAQEIVRKEKDCDYMDELFGGVKMPPTQVYLKSEADKVIADLEESHKMEVEQLLMEIVELKGQYKDMDVTHTVHIAKMNAKIDKLEEDVAWNKYKRCLAMAMWCELGRTERFSVLYPKNFGYLLMKKWHKIWMELAEKFKEAK